MRNAPKFFLSLYCWNLTILRSQTLKAEVFFALLHFYIFCSFERFAKTFSWDIQYIKTGYVFYGTPIIDWVGLLKAEQVFIFFSVSVLFSPVCKTLTTPPILMSSYVSNTCNQVLKLCAWDTFVVFFSCVSSSIRSNLTHSLTDT